MYKKITRKDGSVIILAPKSDTKALTFQVMYKVGSRQETASLNGSSHFVEHLMFKGTKKRPSTLVISKSLDAVGAEYNAFTAKDRTAYFVKADSSHLGLAVEILSDMLRHSVFDPKEIEKERGVILEEMSMYQDNPVMYMEDVYESLLYQGTPLARLIIGSRENIGKKISRADLYRYKQRWYYPGNMIIGLAGKFDEKEALRQIDHFFPIEKKRTTKAKITPIKVQQTQPRVKIYNKETEQIQIMLGFPSLPSQHRDIPALTVMSIILGGNMSSRLFINIRERKSLCYFVRSMVETYEDTGSFAVRAGLDKKRLNLALKLIKAELDRLRTKGVTAEELSRAKEYLKGSTILRLEDAGDYLYFLQSQELLHNKIETVEDKLKKIEQVKRSDIQAVARKIIQWKKSNLGIIGPYTSPAEFLKILKS